MLARSGSAVAETLLDVAPEGWSVDGEIGPIAGLNEDAGALLVFTGDKSTQTGHVWGCYSGGSGFVWLDGSTAPVRSKASNRCAGCARAAAFEAMTMLRQDAEENSAPGHVLTLTSLDADVTSVAYRQACRLLWLAFRKRWGHVEYCGFIEWTTGKAARSGGLRRLHSHWLVKRLELLADEYVSRARGKAPCSCGDSTRCVECWTASTWKGLTGAWVVQVRELRTVGGVVGYLALHHEKMEQAPPKGWTGRRLRPSRGYFAVSGRIRRERARAWLCENRWNREGLDDGAKLARAQKGSPRLVGALAEWEKASRAVIDSAPGWRGDSLPAQRALDARLLSVDAPIHAALVDRLAEDETYERWRVAYRARAERRERRAGVR